MKFTWSIVRKQFAQRLENSYGWDSERSMQCAELICDEICKQYGGKQHYIPKKNGILSRRVADEFDGRNFAELSQNYGLSIRTVRRYILKHKK